jgi:hypothetical protein
MKRRHIVFLVLAPIAVTVTSWAKGDLVFLEIMGGSLQSTIKITDHKIGDFVPWAGPGIDNPSLEQEGFIIDWKAGVASEPEAAVERHQVAFYVGCQTTVDDPRCIAEKPHLGYVVLYAYDPKTQAGFVYLPRIKELWWGNVNGGTIYHGSGIEGHWFHATTDWISFVQPILEKGSLGASIR